MQKLMVGYSIYSKDTEGRYTFANAADVRLIGAKSMEEVMGQTVKAFFPKDVAEKLTAEDQRVMRTGDSIINQEGQTFDQATGQQTWHAITKMALRNSDGKVVGVVGINRDIIKRKHAEEALEEERNLLRTLIDALPDRIWSKDMEGRHTLGNPTFLDQRER